MVVTCKGSPHQPAIMGESNRPFSASGQPPGICNAGIFIRPDGAMLGTGQPWHPAVENGYGGLSDPSAPLGGRACG